MKLYVLALLCAFAALGLVTQASSSDFLDAMQLGESMSTPLPLDLVQKAKAAGVITGSPASGSAYPDETQSIGTSESSTAMATSGSSSNPGPVDSSAGVPSGDSLDSSMPSTSAQAANATGIWSIDLKDTADRHLDLSLFQNGDVILGYGSMTSENETQGVTVSGSVEGSEIDLSVTTMNTLDLYKLQLAPSGGAMSGSYSAYEAGGKTWSGTATGTSSASAFGSTSPSGNSGEPDGTAESAATRTAGPVDQSDQSAAVLGSGAGSSTAVTAGPVSGQSSSTYAGTAGSSISSSSAGSGSNSQSIQIGTGSTGSYSSMTSTSSTVYG